MPEPVIGFVGAGNMGQALIQGLVNSGYKPEHLIASDPNEAYCEQLRQRFHIRTTHENRHACLAADVLVLAVKPQQIEGVLTELSHSLADRQPLVISIAAGVPIAGILRLSAVSDLAVVRCMPNTPALVQAGVTALYANADVQPAQRELAESIMRAVGSCIWLAHEDLMDLVTALSGSGPAYFYFLMEALIDAAVGLGMQAEQARLFCLQTAYGAAKLAIAEGGDVAELRRRVTSPGGTTAAAIAVFEQQQLRSIVQQALKAAAERSKELANMFGEQQ